MAANGYIGVAGVARKVKNEYIGVSGVARKVTNGYVGVSGVARKFFSAGVPALDLPVGGSVKLKVNGTLRDFLVIHQGLPDTTMYDDSCDGTWLLMNDVYETRQWHSSNFNSYDTSTIHAYLNGTFLNLFDADIKSAIKQVKISYYTHSEGSGKVKYGANGLSAKIFLLSAYEVGFWYSNTPFDGSRLSYFMSGTGISAKNKRIGKLNGSATNWWLRSPNPNLDSRGWYVNAGGDIDGDDCTAACGVRPALVLPSDFAFPEGSVSVS